MRLRPITLALLCASCASDPVEEPTATRAQEVSIEAPFERLIPWGEGREALRLEPRVPESVAYGPNAVAALPDGRALILDRLAGRVVRVGATPEIETVATIPVDSEELVAGDDGSFLAFSPMRARAFLFDADARAAGEVSIARALHDRSSLGLGPSRRVLVRTGYQETLVVGSPSAPLPLAVTLRTKREGAFQLADGRGVACRVDQDGARLELVSQSSDDSARSSVITSHPLPGNPTSARVIGLEQTTACLKLENVTSLPQMRVERRALCLDVESGHVRLEKPLPAPGLYLPRTELAQGGGRLVFIHAEPDGLRVRSFEVTP